MTQAWTKKYEPKNSGEIIGQEKAVVSLKHFILNYKNARKKAMILYGPPGCGKTCSIYAVAGEVGLEVIEINASDCRNKDAISSIIGSASKQMSLFARSKLILVDEIDGLSGTKDRGGATAIVDIVNQSSFPIIMTSNNPYDKKFSALRKVSVIVEFDALKYNDIYGYLAKICEKENIVYEEQDLKSLARRAGGDLRGSIVDLQLLSCLDKTFDRKGLEELEGRKQTETMPQALVKVFKTTDPKIAITAFDNVDEDLDTARMWVDYNLGKEYTKSEDLYRAYMALGKADIFNHRIRRWQHWRYLVYVNALMTAGVAVAKDEKYKFTGYKPTSRILKMWMANLRNAKKKAIAEKIALKTHTSTKRVMQDVLPYLQIILKKDKQFCNNISAELDLDKDEIAWLRK